MTDPQADETSADEPTPDATDLAETTSDRPDATMRTFGFIIAIALVLIAITFIVDFANELY